ncbi:MAG TPA: non-homologous end-joining DNA ligase [Kineosporiaceae bacterium]|nr:non-homologous end-joining DNA ligase [Kineosporiaceae bacterium]
MARTTQPVEVDGRVLALSNLDKVLYPATGTTKAEVISYYTQVAPAFLPLVAGRPVTRKRWPDGVDGPAFFEKNAPQGTPDWIRTVRLPVPGSTRDREEIDYALIDGLADLVWTANLAALEIHVPQWTVGPRGAVRGPDRLVVDLDPGAPAGLAECVEVALAVRERLADDGLASYPVTSGGKGMQLYAPISGAQDARVVHAYARRVAEELERRMPRLVVSRMTKALRPGKVLLDWSQNHPAKTTISPYSLRGRDHPTVAAPRTWAELDDAAASGGPRQLGDGEVLARLAADGDLLGPLLARGPRLPSR